MRRALSFLLVVSVLLNVFLMVSLKRDWTNIRERSMYTLLSPRVFLERPNDVIVYLLPLRKQLNEFVAKQKFHAGLYMEYLPTGASIGVREKENFPPASLLKVPLVMAIYKMIENGDLHWNDALELKEGHIDPSFGTMWARGAGTKITVREAVTTALTQSDNTAARLLADAVSDEFLADVFEEIDIPLETESNIPLVTAKNYSSIFRSLYLASYLTRSSSNEILHILTNTLYKDKMPAGLPSDIIVSHKVGVSFADEAKKMQTYSDCGIVYIPKRPFLLCTMVEADENVAREFIKQTTRLVYDYFSAYEKPNQTAFISAPR